MSFGVEAAQNGGAIAQYHAGGETMLSNLHTHSVFCDGKSTPEEIVLAAIDGGFTSIGFSGHGYTPFDLSYCLRDTEGYLAELDRLRSVYGKKIEIYRGLEEDAMAPADRSRFDYIIGSSHYLCIRGEYHAIDSGREYFEACLAAVGGSVTALAETYYTAFCDYIKKRRPDIIGHFDLITKYDEQDPPRLLNDPEYRRIALRFVAEAATADCLFEVNTGAMARGLRTSPYPSEELLHYLKACDARLILSSDSHVASTLGFAFAETERYLYDIGFRHVYALVGGEFVKRPL